MNVSRSSAKRAAAAAAAVSAGATEPPLSTSGKIFFGSLCAGTFSLGVWQLLRLQQKTEMIDERNRQLALDPSRDVSSEVEPYRRRLVSGVFRHDREVLIGPRGAPSGVVLPRQGLSSKQKIGSGSTGMAPGPQGYYVFTPLELSSAWNEGNRQIVWINRGWIPRSMVGQSSSSSKAWNNPGPSWHRPTGKVELTAVRSYPEHPKFMTPEHDYSKRPLQMFWIDGQALKAMVSDIDDLNGARQNDKDDVLLLLTNVDTSSENDNDKNNAPASYPVSPPVASVGDFKTSPAIHAGYAATWFGLSGAGLYMTRKMIRRGR